MLISFPETNSIPGGSYVLILLPVENRKKMQQKEKGERNRLKAYHIPQLVLLILQSRVAKSHRFFCPIPESVQA